MKAAHQSMLSFIHSSINQSIHPLPDFVLLELLGSSLYHLLILVFRDVFLQRWIRRTGAWLRWGKTSQQLRTGWVGVIEKSLRTPFCCFLCQIITYGQLQCPTLLNHLAFRRPESGPCRRFSFRGCCGLSFKDTVKIMVSYETTKIRLKFQKLLQFLAFSPLV